MVSEHQPQAARYEGSPHATSEGLYGQATDAMSNMADGASEMWDEAYRQGARYYREADGSTLSAAIVAGLVGYALAYLIHHRPPAGRHRSTTSRNYVRDEGRGRY